MKVSDVTLLGQGDRALILKIDDKDFKATNPGVWVSYVQEHLDRKKFTDWEKYTKDLPIKVDSEH